jgi:hypothetical protein
MLRLHHDGVNAREIARTLRVARTTIQDNLSRCGHPGLAGHCRPSAATRFSNSGCLHAAASSLAGPRYSEPDWATLSRELKPPAGNLMLSWEEDRESHPGGYGYSRFCNHFVSSNAACHW